MHRDHELESGGTRGTRVREAAANRELIYQLRHEVYARELGQHAVNARGMLRDGLDERNVYLVSEERCGLAGFVSITPPGGCYAFEKYIRREELPFAVHDRLFEVRLLTVRGGRRRGLHGPLLMLAALRWIEEHGGSHVVCIGRREVLRLYRRAGLRGTGIEVRAGAVVFEVLHAGAADLAARLHRFSGLVRRVERTVAWDLDFPLRRPAACFHGGAFFEAIGEGFTTLGRRRGVINADVLDAWFPPAPAVLAELRRHLGWLARTSPPAAARGMLEAIARARGVEPDCLLPGAGSSALMFLAFRTWLRRDSRVLLFEPTYGEYAHILGEVIGCRVDRLRLRRDRGYVVAPAELAAAVGRGYDLVVLVNPNSPTGRHLDRASVEAVLGELPAATRMWIDETYVDYVGSEQSLEGFASRSRQVAVCKSMSKVYALSGLRVAYLCAAPQEIAALRAWTPPWAVGLPAQVAAVRALEEGEYYRRRYAETHRLRERLRRGLVRLGLDPVPGEANFLLVHLPAAGPAAPALLARCRARGLFLRDTGSLSPRLRDAAFRIAVKDAATTARMLAILGEELAALGAPPAAAGGSAGDLALLGAGSPAPGLSLPRRAS
jgi:histidinol-phosphate/aromatic aminotransferase/cobyric acid decarboxylase-like protein